MDSVPSDATTGDIGPTILIMIAWPPNDVFKSNDARDQSDQILQVHGHHAEYAAGAPEERDAKAVVWEEDGFGVRVSSINGVSKSTLLKVARGLVRNPGGTPPPGRSVTVPDSATH
jgi:hypothetical protein